ncbi:hypothetical protein OG225_41255 (plasmid) [Nocardia sp. NBC_01377]|uniref:hypothetical protein n=1 Tax=Nocardia sp. NBC_01377 TaxID=2903595 RepID=UPI002F91ACA7
MAEADLNSDRTIGPVPRDQDELPDATRAGLVAYVAGLIDQDWFAERFPERCRDGNSICATHKTSLGIAFQAIIPGISIPPNPDRMSDLEVFDLLEYAYPLISKPKQGDYHSFRRHHEYTFFNRRSAPGEFRDQVNHLLARGGANYEMDDEGQIQRRGSASVRRLVRELRPDTGDDVLDELILRATRLYTSTDPQVRQDALEKLWDGFERLKSIRDPNKQRGAEALLEGIEPPDLRTAIEKEMFALRDIGNQFRIRHSEVGQVQVPDSARDYLLTRMGDLLMYLLAENNWLSADHDDYDESNAFDE